MSLSPLSLAHGLPFQDRRDPLLNSQNAIRHGQAPPPPVPAFRPAVWSAADRTGPGLDGQLPLVGQGQEEIGQKSQQADKGLPPRGGQAAWDHDRRIIPLFLSNTKRRKQS